MGREDGGWGRAGALEKASRRAKIELYVCVNVRHASKAPTPLPPARTQELVDASSRAATPPASPLVWPHESHRVFFSAQILFWGLGCQGETALTLLSLRASH